MVSPPTPPLTESDVQRATATKAARSSTSSSLVDATTAIYHDIFPIISNLAIQNRLPELIDLAETTELTISLKSRADQSRLLLVAPLVLSYITVNDLPQAHIVLSRLPDALASHALPQSLAKLTTALKNRNYPLIYKRIDEGLETVQGNFFNSSLAALVKVLLERLIHDFRRKTAELISKAYSSLPLPLAATYLNIPEDNTRKLLEQLGWTYNSLTNQLSPSPSFSGTSSFPGRPSESRKFPSFLIVSPLTFFAASLSPTARQLIGAAAQIESLVELESCLIPRLQNHCPRAVIMTFSGDKVLTNGASVKTEGGVDDIQLGQDESGPPEVWIKLKFTWAGKSYDLDIAESDRVYDLKSLIFSMTNVPPDRQKVLGLVKGKLPSEEAAISDLSLTTGKKFSLVGTPLGDEIKDPSKMEELPDVFNDLDLDFSENPEASRAYIADKRNQRKVKEITQRLRENLTLMHPLREGKKLLVLDIDYTILDTKPLLEGSLPPIECARPRLHEFLEAIYPYYDICVWSQTSWIWLETKLHELGMIGSERNRYKINFARVMDYVLIAVLDKTCMFKVFSVRNGQQFPHHVKPLKVIWNIFPQYDASNTIHVDDLSRNFALNPGEGLKIGAFKEAHTLRATEDRELEKLTLYMVHIANAPDLRTINHRDWKKVARSLRSEPQSGTSSS